jgi:hypothetical protein
MAPAATAMKRVGRRLREGFMVCIGASSLWIQRKVMSRVLQKNKPEPYAASQDFINAILCDGLLILSK